MKKDKELKNLERRENNERDNILDQLNAMKDKNKQLIDNIIV